MQKLLVIGVGGFIGALLRYGIGTSVQTMFKQSSFPLGTLAVNLLGCFIIGIVTYFVESRGVLSIETRSFILVGLLGAFTTFSSFGMETINLLNEGKILQTLTNIILHLLLGLGAVWLGRYLSQMMTS
jgi:CrcB protein